MRAIRSFRWVSDNRVMRERRRSRVARAVVGGCAVAFLLALPALALSIVGTNGRDTIRGTPGADRISARGGDDKVFGLAGDDVLIGGPGRDHVDGGAGSDRLLLRDASRDTAVCGPGRDTVVADRIDAVRADCETVRKPSPPSTTPPPAPSPRPVVPGNYGGRTSQDEGVTFEVGGGGTLTRLVFPSIHLACQPAAGPPVSWPYDSGDSVFLVSTDGSFAVDETGAGTVVGLPASYRIVVTGRLTSGIASGAVKLDLTYASGLVTYGCAAPNVTWTAAAAILNQP